MNDQRTLETVVATSADQVSGNLTGERVVLSMKDGTYYGLTEVGALVWDLLQKPVSVGQLVEQIQASYEIDRETCERDLWNLLDDMSAKDLVVFR
jgi:hypothetical protein